MRYRIPLKKYLGPSRRDNSGVYWRLGCEVFEAGGHPATQPHDIALLQEIRFWLRSMPEEERLRRVQKLSEEGDKSALRALLTAPAYLTGVDSERHSGVPGPFPPGSPEIASTATLRTGNSKGRGNLKMSRLLLHWRSYPGRAARGSSRR